MEIIQSESGKVVSIGTIHLPVHDDLVASPGKPAMMNAVKDLSLEQQVLIVQDGGLTVPDNMPPERVQTMAMSFVQNAWYRAHKGEVPQGVLDGHEARIKTFERIARETAAAPVKEPKAPKAAKEPKPPKEPKAPKAAKPEAVSTGARISQVQSYVVNPAADLTKHQPWIDENKFRKLVFEVLRDNGPATIEQLMPKFVAVAGAELRAADGGKNQTRYRIKELLEAGIAIGNVSVNAPAAPEVPTGGEVKPVEATA